MADLPTFRIQRAVAASSLPAPIRAYLSALAVHADGSYSCWPSNATIADAMGVSTSSVEKRRAKAIDLGVIASRQRRAGSAVTKFDITRIEQLARVSTPASALQEPDTSAVREPDRGAVPEPDTSTDKPLVEPPREPEKNPPLSPRVQAERQEEEGLALSIRQRLREVCGREPCAKHIRDLIEKASPEAWNGPDGPLDRERLICAALSAAERVIEQNDRRFCRVILYTERVIVNALADGVYPEPREPEKCVPAWRRERDAAREAKLAAVRAARRESKADAVRERRQRRADSMDWSGFPEADSTPPDAADALNRGETRLSTQTPHTPTSPVAQRAAEEAVTCTN